MRTNYLLAFFTIIILFGCEKADEFSYPYGFTIEDLESINDCSLPLCAENRIIRFRSKNTIGILEKSKQELNTYFLFYPASYDSNYKFYFCNLPDSLKIDGANIRYSGNIIDACGIYESVWPVEDTYIIHLTEVVKIN